MRIKPWTAAEDKHLKQIMMATGKPAYAADQLGRTVAATRERWYLLKAKRISLEQATAALVHLGNYATAEQVAQHLAASPEDVEELLEKHWFTSEVARDRDGQFTKYYSLR